MEDLTSGVMGLLVSTAVITTFGEIIPQAVCSRYALVVGAHTTWFVYFFLLITLPVAYPLSAILDKVLGDEVGNAISRTMLGNIFKQLEEEGVFNKNERKIMQAALELEQKSVKSVMTPIDKVYMLEINTKIDQNSMKEIYQRGHSRIPVYEHHKDNIIGILMARDLLLINPDKIDISLKQLSSILLRNTVNISADDKLEPLLGYFKKGLTHIGVVTEIQVRDGRDPTHSVVGIVTLEDIIEEIIQDEIEDEYEMFDDKQHRRLMKQKLVQLFTDHRAESTLPTDEINAVIEYLGKYIGALDPARLKPNGLAKLVRKSCVLEI